MALRPSRPAIITGCILLAGATLVWVAAERAGCRPVEAGFWFEPVAYTSTTAGTFTAREMEVIASVATSELVEAFARLNITFSDRRDARSVFAWCRSFVIRGFAGTSGSRVNRGPSAAWTVLAP